jgi:hypothetical protein
MSTIHWTFSNIFTATSTFFCGKECTNPVGFCLGLSFFPALAVLPSPRSGQELLPRHRFLAIARLDSKLKAGQPAIQGSALVGLTWAKFFTWKCH